VIGLLFEDWFQARFDDPSFAGTMLLVTGTFVWSSRWAQGDRPGVASFVPAIIALGVSAFAGTAIPFLVVLGVEALIMGVSRATASRGEAEPGWGTALAMGIAQAAAILPGISRSGSTVITGLWRRLDGVKAAEFSFLMSIPAILGAAVLSLPDLADGPTVGTPQLIGGALAAGLAGILAIRFFVGMLRRGSFHAFAWYCWAAGTLFLLSR
jgi:undecaprenyl-diphosphatase